ncbi:MAG TPA: RnfH family protein [Candidatus Paenalcaligenes intestinipullorum]|uniref:UPF0125 protein H9906_03375 n=1 Tax=Candidatus Paenalcaligenes intestinipullorum TaxID=2838718 RepID=A0A9D2RIK2_9BURK|nr:RnfH family protein [Candidatus Paenalcaligenes intestinipullorum]
MSKHTLTLQVVYALPHTLWQQDLTVPAHTTIAQALKTSTLYREHPETVNLDVGVFGELVQTDRLVKQGDRIEIYRPLSFDPMESRRRRAEHRARQSAQKTGGKALSIAAQMLPNRNT